MSEIPEIVRRLALEDAFNEAMSKKHSSEECRKHEEAMNNLCKKIAERLGDKSKDLAWEVEEMLFEENSLNDEWLYYQGMLDCAEFLKALSLI